MGDQGQARIALPDASAEGDAGAPVHRPVTPRLVARIVRWALAQGWSPDKPGLTVLRYADGWGGARARASRHLRRLLASCEQALLALRVQAQEVLLRLGLPTALAQAYAEAFAGYLGMNIAGEHDP